MAPTEILARQQHARTVRSLGSTPPVVRAALLTASTPRVARTSATFTRSIAAGEVGPRRSAPTPCSSARDVALRRASPSSVVDEQHRFGVAQRAALQAKAGERDPHVLALTATPIPRTLALTFYGDLAISTIRELPPGRQAVRTEIRDRSALPKIQQFLADEAREGRQSFVVVPLVAESAALEAASAEAEAERLRDALPALRIGIVHGQQKADLRDGTMARFAAGELDVLVATTVIEVGIDIPNASVILIEDAERFGLAQLHQLRGRVGRGTQRSYCILLSDASDERSRERLEVLRGSNDGFVIAEADLALRGAGNLLGTRQAGLPPLRVASLFEPRHIRLAWAAKDLADRLLEADPTLSGRPALARAQAEFVAREEGDDTDGH